MAPKGTKETGSVEGFEDQQRRKGGVKGGSQHVQLIDKVSIPFFFTNISDSASHSDLWKLFAKFGYVGKVFIPKKVDKWG